MSGDTVTKIQHVKDLWRAMYASGSIYEALDHAEAMLLLDRDSDGIQWQAHWISFVVSYCRPFTSNSVIGGEKTSLILLEHRDLHNEVYSKHRNRSIAHTHPGELTLNDLIFTIENGVIRSDPLRHHPSREYVQGCFNMARAVSENLAARIASCIARFPELASFKNGDYRFRIDRDLGDEWEAIP
jgi:hypothetical protein